MPSFPHEALLQLFRTEPALISDLLRHRLHTSLGLSASVRVGEADLTELTPTEYHADMVLVFERPGRSVPRYALVLEVQLGRNSRKRWSWPVYLTGLRARLHCDVGLLVVTNDARIARWSARPIHTGHPDWVLTPLVLGPNAVPFVRDQQQAQAAPELAVLSAIIHGKHPDAIRVAQAALAGARTLDDERAKLYCDLVVMSVHRAARAALEALMVTKNYEYQSDFAKRFLAQGRVEGEAKGRVEGRVEGRLEGEAKGRARAVLTVLAARGLAVPAKARTRILKCTDVAKLDTWLTRAATAASAAEVMDE